MLCNIETTIVESIEEKKNTVGVVLLFGCLESTLFFRFSDNGTLFCKNEALIRQPRVLSAPMSSRR